MQPKKNTFYSLLFISTISNIVCEQFFFFFFRNSWKVLTDVVVGVFKVGCWAGWLTVGFWKNIRNIPSWLLQLQPGCLTKDPHGVTLRGIRDTSSVLLRLIVNPQTNTCLESPRNKPPWMVTFQEKVIFSQSCLRKTLLQSPNLK